VHKLFSQIFFFLNNFYIKKWNTLSITKTIVPERSTYLIFNTTIIFFKLYSHDKTFSPKHFRMTRLSWCKHQLHGGVIDLQGSITIKPRRGSVFNLLRSVTFKASTISSGGCMWALKLVYVQVRPSICFWVLDS